MELKRLPLWLVFFFWFDRTAFTAVSRSPNPVVGPASSLEGVLFSSSSALLLGDYNPCALVMTRSNVWPENIPIVCCQKFFLLLFRLSFKRSKCWVCCRFWSWSDLITVAEFVNLVRNSMWTQCLECASTKMPSFCIFESYPQCH